jgi:tetratricopeptide (TPR) repeat protein
MVSSTLSDLSDIRGELIDWLERYDDVQVRVCEYWSASPNSPLEKSLELAGACDIYILLLGSRYGSCPPGQTKSYTELEFEHASERKNVPIFVFVQDASPETLSDDETAHEQWEKRCIFVDRLEKSGKTLKSFKRATNIIGEIAHALPKYLSNVERKKLKDRENPRPHFVHDYSLLDTALFGREKQLAAMDAWAQSKDSLIGVIDDIGGMGKSSLAYTWWQRQFPTADAAKEARGWDGGLWYSFYEPDTSYEHLLVELHSYCSGTPANDLSDKKPSELEQLVESDLESNRVLVVLDGFEATLLAYSELAADLEDARHGRSEATASDKPETNILRGRAGREMKDKSFARFLVRLAKRGRLQSKFLLTTRMCPLELEATTGLLDRVTQWSLGGIDVGAAKDYWHACGLDAADPDLPDFVGSIGGYPLALSIMAGTMRIAATPTLAEFRRFDPDFDVFDPGITHDKARSDVFGAAFRRLPEKERGLLNTVAVFRRPAKLDLLEAIHTQSTRWYAEAQFETREDLIGVLNHLQEMRFIGWRMRMRAYEMHPVIRGLVRKREDPSALRETAAETLHHLARVPAPVRVASVEDLEVPLQVYFSMIELGRFREALLHFVNDLNPALQKLNANSLRRECLEEVFEIAQQGSRFNITFRWDGDEAYGLVGKSEFSQGLAKCYEEEADWERALALHEIHGQSGVCRDPVCRTSTAGALKALGRFGEAEKIFLESRAALKSFTLENSLVVDTLRKSAIWKYSDREHYEGLLNFACHRMARDHFERAIERKDPKIARLALARTIQALRKRLQQKDKSLFNFNNERDYMRDWNLELADLALIEGQPDAAASIARAVIADAKEDVSRNYEARALIALADSWTALGDASQAEKALREHIKIKGDEQEMKSVAPAWRKLVLALIEQRRLDEAERVLEGLVQRAAHWRDCEESAHISMAQAKLANARGNTTAAIEHERAVVEAYTAHPGTPADQAPLPDVLPRLIERGLLTTLQIRALRLGPARRDLSKHVNPFDSHFTWSSGRKLQPEPTWTLPSSAS